VYQIAAGYENANDATYLRMDPTFQTVVGRLGTPLASQPTLSRLEPTATWEDIHRLGRTDLDWYCRHGQGRSREVILDIDWSSRRSPQAVAWIVFTTSRYTCSTSRSSKPAAPTLWTVSRFISGPTRLVSGVIRFIISRNG